MAPAKSTKVIATFPPGYFLENIALLRDDSLLITVPNRQELYCLPPAPTPSAARVPILLHKFEEDQWTMAMCNAPNDLNLIYLVTTDFTGTGRRHAHLHVLNSSNVADGSHPVQLMQFPPNAKGLNGMCQLSSNVILAADGFEGVIWRIDITFNKNVAEKAEAREWLRDDAFTGVLKLPDFQPGVNGLKYSPSSGYVCFSNSQQKTFGKIKVNPHTFDPVGESEILATGMQGDDLIIDEGYLGGPVAYLTAHRDNTVLRIPIAKEGLEATEKEVEVVTKVTADEAVMLGPTAGVWQRGLEGKVAYFTCDGGLKHPMEDGVVRWARVVRVEF